MGRLIVTQRFIDANKALGPISAFNGADPSRVGLVQDIQERAAQCEAYLQPGQTIRSMQLAWLQCLRSRLEDFYLRDIPAVREWLEAFGNAYHD